MNRVIIDVLPTDSSPRKTSLYFDRGRTFGPEDIAMVFLFSLFLFGARSLYIKIFGFVFFSCFLGDVNACCVLRFPIECCFTPVLKVI